MYPYKITYFILDTILLVPIVIYNLVAITTGNGASALIHASSKFGVVEVISEWARVSTTSSILKSYALCAFDQEAILRAKVLVDGSFLCIFMSTG